MLDGDMVVIPDIERFATILDIQIHLLLKTVKAPKIFNVHPWEKEE